MVEQSTNYIAWLFLFDFFSQSIFAKEESFKTRTDMAFINISVNYDYLCGLIQYHLNSFSALGLSKPLIKALDDLNITTPTPIQEKAIPILLERHGDFIGLAQTGTGKTAAFALPLLEHIDTSKDHLQALILSPTRELGQQIADQIELFSKHQDKVKTLPVYGGTSIMNQIRA
ncbi:MAG: DEAD/DEAH box helicase, partial [Flavobacteriales bacterium]